MCVHRSVYVYIIGSCSLHTYLSVCLYAKMDTITENFNIAQCLMEETPHELLKANYDNNYTNEGSNVGVLWHWSLLSRSIVTINQRETHGRLDKYNMCIKICWVRHHSLAGSGRRKRLYCQGNACPEIN